MQDMLWVKRGSLWTILGLLWQLAVTSADFPVLLLPYSFKSLEPKLSREALESLHDQHYRKYILTVNAMIRTIDRLEESSLEEIMWDSHRWNRPLYNNAAQSWNLNFYFKCMTSNYRPPSQQFEEIISNHFGSFEDFELQLSKVSMSVFGSGWAWLVYDAGKDSVFIHKTTGADNPITEDVHYTPLLAINMWEHAYYLDYQSKRQDFVTTFIESLVDWTFVEENLARARAIAQGDDDPEVDAEDEEKNVSE